MRGAGAGGGLRSTGPRSVKSSRRALSSRRQQGGAGSGPGQLLYQGLLPSSGPAARTAARRSGPALCPLPALAARPGLGAGELPAVLRSSRKKLGVEQRAGDVLIDVFA